MRSQKRALIKSVWSRIRINTYNVIQDMLFRKDLLICFVLSLYWMYWINFRCKYWDRNTGTHSVEEFRSFIHKVVPSKTYGSVGKERNFSRRRIFECTDAWAGMGKAKSRHDMNTAGDYISKRSKPEFLPN